MFIRNLVCGHLKLMVFAILPAILITITAGSTVFANHGGDYHFVNSSTISGPNSTSYVLNSSATPPGYYLSGDSCPDYIVVTGNPGPGDTSVAARLTFVTTSNVGAGCSSITTGSDITIGALDQQDTPPPTGEGVEEEGVTCESQGGETSWIACPLIEGMLGAVQGMTTLMSNLLEIRPLVANDTDPIFAVWSNVRNIALGALVIAMLYMILTQAIRPDTDAYFIKRIIPRISLSAIGIMLSFYVCALLIDLFNVLGLGMQSFMLNAVDGLTITTGVGSEWASGIIRALGVGGVIAVALNPALLITIGLLLLPVVLAFLTALAVVILRQVVIIALIIFAPIAFVAWILPNTDQFFKKWLNTFSNMLMMFPLIMVLLGAGSIYAVIVTNGGGLNTSEGINQNNFINYILALVGLGVTMGAIPFTIRAASGVLRQVAGAINNPNRGPIDRLRKGLEARRDFNKDALRNQRRGERASNPNMSKFRRGMSRTLTGDFGYGTPYGRRSQFGKLQDIEATRSALTTDQKINLLEKEARDKQKGISAGRHRDVTAELSNDAANEYLLNQHASGATEADRNAALEMLIDKGEDRAVDRAIVEAVARAQDTNNIEIINELNRTIQENFPKVDLLTPQHSRSNLLSNFEEHDITDPETGETRRGTEPYQPNYGAVADFKGERMSQVKGRQINASIDYLDSQRTTARANAEAATARGDTNQAEFHTAQAEGYTNSLNQLVNNYSDTIPEKREQVVVQRINRLIEDSSTSLNPTVVSKARAAFSTQPVEQPVAVTPVAAPRITREQVRTMGPINSERFVQSSGGYQSLHEGELLSLANEHGTSTVGQAARQELDRRGITNPPPQPRNLP